MAVTFGPCRDVRGEREGHAAYFAGENRIRGVAGRYLYLAVRDVLGVRDGVAIGISSHDRPAARLGSGDEPGEA